MRAIERAGAVVAYAAHHTGSAVLGQLAPPGGWGALDRSVRSAVVERAAVAGVGSSETLEPGDLGRIYEAWLTEADRDVGAHYTPSGVATALVEVAWPYPADRGPHEVTAWDPSCGGGVFLLAVADRLHREGADPITIITDRLWGTDIDPGAVAVAGAALAWWAERSGADGDEVRAAARSGLRIGAGDALVAAGPTERSFDLIIGNPPFQGQLTGDAVRSRERRAQLRAEWGDAVGPYTDTASLFMVAGSRALRPGGHLAMLLPTSVLAARDSADARRAVLDRTDLVGLWVAGERVFEAAVDVCAVVARARLGSTSPTPTQRSIRLWRGQRFDPVATVEGPTGPRTGQAGPTEGRESTEPWSILAMRAVGIPLPPIRTGGTLADLASAAAGFRDEYYGLVPHVREGPEGIADLDDPARWPTHLAPLVTSGAIDVGTCGWGLRPTRFAKQRFERPVVDLRSLEAAGGRAATWVASTAVPKVVVATQTGVGECAVDRSGRWVPSTPTIAVVAAPDRLWEVAAVICSPVGTVLSLATSFGSGRSATNLKPTSTSVLRLATPADHRAWQKAAEALRRRDRRAYLQLMAEAYGLDDPDELHRWWDRRSPWTEDG